MTERQQQEPTPIQHRIVQQHSGHLIASIPTPPNEPETQHRIGPQKFQPFFHSRNIPYPPPNQPAASSSSAAFSGATKNLLAHRPSVNPPATPDPSAARAVQSQTRTSSEDIPATHQEQAVVCRLRVETILPAAGDGSIDETPALISATFIPTSAGTIQDKTPRPPKEELRKAKRFVGELVRDKVKTFKKGEVVCDITFVPPNELLVLIGGASAKHLEAKHFQAVKDNILEPQYRKRLRGFQVEVRKDPQVVRFLAMLQDPNTMTSASTVNVYISLEETAKSLCGAVICVGPRVPEGRVAPQTWTCGGMISVSGHLYALSVAHPLTKVIESGGDESDVGYLSQRVSKEPISRNWKLMGHVAKSALSGSTTAEEDSDWMLIDVNKEFLLPNTIILKDRQILALTDNDEDIQEQSEPMSENTCTLYTSHGVIEGVASDDETYLMIGPAGFCTTKIFLHSPLRPGDSGTWVINQGQFFGVVIAGSEGENGEYTAFVIKTEDIFTSIARSCFDGDDDKEPETTVRLPTVAEHREMEARRYGHKISGTDEGENASQAGKKPVLPTPREQTAKADVQKISDDDASQQHVALGGVGNGNAAAGSSRRRVNRHTKGLLNAVKHGREGLVLMILDMRVDVNSRVAGSSREDNKTALEWAVSNNKEKIVRMLLEAGADVNSGGKEETALEWATCKGNEKIVRILLDAGADVNSRGEDGSALEWAVCRGKERIVRMLLDAGADVNSRGEDKSALELAVWKGKEGIVRMLLDAGADVNSRGEDRSALEWAVCRGKEGIVRMLLEKRE